MESSKNSTEQEKTSSELRMEHMHGLVNSTTGMRNVNTPASVYLANEINPQPAISDLNMFRPNGGSLPLWNSSPQGTQPINYSLLPGKPMTTTAPGLPHMEPDTASHNGTSKGPANSYDMFSSNGHEEANSFQFSPNASMGHNSNHESGASSSEEDQEEVARPLGQPTTKRKPRTAVPEERKDDKYWARRRKNNDAAKKSREMRRKKLEQELRTAKEAIAENAKLKQEIDLLKSEINSLRRLLKDANTTLSLWIRARQASEPNVQLPPMLRGSNVSFVNFPATTAS